MTELTTTSALAEKVSALHGTRHPELCEGLADQCPATYARLDEEGRSP